MSFIYSTCNLTKSDSSIFLVTSTGYGVFDCNGKRLSYNYFNWKFDNSYIMNQLLYIFHGRIWFEEFTKVEKGIEIKIVQSDMNLKDQKIVKRFTVDPSKTKGVDTLSCLF